MNFQEIRFITINFEKISDSVDVKPLRIFIFHTVVILYCTFNLFGQDTFINYTTKDGLPSNQVYDIYQDDHGVIWFATDRGLSSFNGSFFTNYTTLDGLLSDVIFDFFPQKDGTVWCTTDKNELVVFNPIKLTFTPFKYNHLLPDDNDYEVKSILVEAENYFFRFKGKMGYLRISAKGDREPVELIRSETHTDEYYLTHLKEDFYYYSISTTDAANLMPMTVSYRDMIIVNGDHLARLNYSHFEIVTPDKFTKKLKLLDHSELLEAGVTDDLFWVTGYNIGVKLISKNGKVVKTYLSDLPCSSFFKDKDEGTWISTLSNGVFYLPVNSIAVLVGSKDEYITSLSTNNRALAFGTHSGKVVEYFLDGGQMNTGNSSTKGILQYSDHRLYSNLTDQKNDDLSSYVRKFSDSPGQRLLYSTSHTFWEISNKKLLHLSKTSCYDIEPFNENMIVSEGTAIRLMDSSGKFLKSIDLHTTTLDLDVYKNKIYCATSSKGLIVLDTNLKLLKVINIASGLKSNFISEVAIHKGIVWLGTRNGISQITDYDSKNEKISTISVSNGLSDNEVTDFDFVGDTIFLGTRRGVNYFDIGNWDKITKSNTSIFFSIKRISQQGKELYSTDNLAHDQNDLTVEVELASYNLNKTILFRYKLEGIDKDWTVTRSRMMNFKSLPPGEYNLLIQANVNDNWYDAILQQKIIIYPPWFEAWWFVLLVTLLIVFTIWLFFKYRILNYNREIIREILRQLLKRLTRKSKHFIVRSNGKDIRIDSEKVLYVQSNGNYLTIHTDSQKVVIREKISDFLNLVPDPIEFVQVRRSVIVRIDKVTSKSKDTISIQEVDFKLGVTYLHALKHIHLK